MGRKLSTYLSSIVLLTGIFVVGCEWTGGSDSDFNTSRGGANINVSGFYRGNSGGQFAVLRKAGGAVTSLVLQQSGATIEVTDSNGQNYRGSVSSPTVGNVGSVISLGQQVANFQLSWSGTDGTAATEVDFTGVIDVVATDNIQSSVQVRSPNQADGPNDQVGTGDTIEVRQFALEESNAQFRLRGTWVQAIGGSSPVDAISPGAGTLQFQEIIANSAISVTDNPVVPEDSTVGPVTITPALSTLAVGASQQFCIQGQSPSATWSLSVPSGGRLSSSKGKCVTYTALAQVQQTITAATTDGQFVDTVTINQTITAITIATSSPSPGVGETVFLTASGGDGSYKWSLANSSLGSLSSSSGTSVSYTVAAGAAGTTQTIFVNDGISTATLAIPVTN